MVILALCAKSPKGNELTLLSYILYLYLLPSRRPSPFTIFCLFLFFLFVCLFVFVFVFVCFCFCFYLFFFVFFFYCLFIFFLFFCFFYLTKQRKQILKGMALCRIFPYSSRLFIRFRFSYISLDFSLPVPIGE